MSHEGFIDYTTELRTEILEHSMRSIESLASLLAETAAAARRTQREEDAEIAAKRANWPEEFFDFSNMDMPCIKVSRFAAAIEQAIRAGDAAETSE